MPVLIEMRLKASWAVRPDTRQLHGLACALFEGASDGHLGQDKPFSVWPLCLAPGEAGETVGAWRSAWLPDGPAPAAVTAADVLRVGHVTCAVTEMAAPGDPCPARAGPVADSATVSFSSPTYFSQNGGDVVLPDPRLIVGSWRRRWNSSLPDTGLLAIGEDAWRETHRALRLATFDLRTDTRDSGHERNCTGFTGTAVLRLDRSAPAAARAVLGTLARFAEYCGTGAQTTHGFGATTVSFASGGGNG